MVQEATDCCMSCDSRRRERLAKEGNFAASLTRRMIVCPDCGNKRCPRATHHSQRCTASNEPGQRGSLYR